MEYLTEDPDLLAIAVVAKELGVTPQSIHGALNENRLPFTVMYGRKLISRADLDAYKQRTRPNGEKPKGRPPGAKNKPKGQEKAASQPFASSEANG